MKTIIYPERKTTVFVASVVLVLLLAATAGCGLTGLGVPGAGSGVIGDVRVSLEFAALSFDYRQEA